tara:strand:+ start:185 stop:304 length:120 start_codon:yes stop_codon:yes gene_type:complete
MSDGFVLVIKQSWLGGWTVSILTHDNLIDLALPVSDVHA